MDQFYFYIRSLSRAESVSNQTHRLVKVVAGHTLKLTERFFRQRPMVRLMAENTAYARSMRQTMLSRFTGSNVVQFSSGRLTEDTGILLVKSAFSSHEKLTNAFLNEMTYSSISIVHVYPPRSKALFPLTGMQIVYGAQVNGTLVLVSLSGSTGIRLIMSFSKGFSF